MLLQSFDKRMRINFFQSPAQPRLFHCITSSALFLVLASCGYQARWTSRDSAECRSSAAQTMAQALHGLAASSQLIDDYCSCAEVAIKSGDTLSSATDFCSKSILSKWGIPTQ